MNKEEFLEEERKRKLVNSVQEVTIADTASSLTIPISGLGGKRVRVTVQEIEKTYTFDELRKEPGTYQMVESVQSRIIVHADDCVQFLFGEHSQEVIGNFRFDATYRKVSE
jgi:hypothetical protein